MCCVDKLAMGTSCLRTPQGRQESSTNAYSRYNTTKYDAFNIIFFIIVSSHEADQILSPAF